MYGAPTINRQTWWWVTLLKWLYNLLRAILKPQPPQPTPKPPCGHHMIVRFSQTTFDAMTRDQLTSHTGVWYTPAQELEADDETPTGFMIMEHPEIDALDNDYMQAWENVT